MQWRFYAARTSDYIALLLWRAAGRGHNANVKKNKFIFLFFSFAFALSWLNDQTNYHKLIVILADECIGHKQALAWRSIAHAKVL